MNAEVRQGPVTEASKAVFAEKYCQMGEDFRGVCNRVAYALADGPDHYHRLRSILLDMRFLPGGRIYASAGSTKRTTASNCFVSGTLGDSLVEGPDSIMHKAYEAAATMRMGGGIGYDFSTLRPSGDYIAGLDSHSTGPISFMRIFNEIGCAISSSGHRRGAQMGVLRVDHPDIERFILAKQNQDQLTGFNLSIAITDEFMKAVEKDTLFTLRFNGRGYRHVVARDLWEMIMRSTWDWAEPGVLFIDTINNMNNLYYCENIAATNPCAEQPLPPYGACLLGSINLTAYLKPMPLSIAGRARYWIDIDGIRRDMLDIVRALDNVIERSLYPLPAQQAEAKAKRRLGVGVTGLANAAESCGHPYGTGDFIQLEEDILEAIRDEAYAASVQLASEKGAFPMFDRDAYLSGHFVKNLPPKIKDGIAQHGIRNSHLTSIAPTGTISFCADNISSGIEPVFFPRYDRKVNTAQGEVVHQVEDYGIRALKVEPRPSGDVSVKEHLAVLTAAQKYVDSSISKTCNVGNEVGWEEFKDVYKSAYYSGAKGCTTYRADGEKEGIIEEVKECVGDRCAVA